MTAEQLSFVNQQLAGMLRSGIPLEGALRQLCADMQAGRLRDELRALETDLAKGIPLAEALPARRLPPFYVKMLQLGVRGNDLPGVLIVLADHYQRQHLLWTRLSGLLIYPALVLVGAVALSVFLAGLMQSLFGDPQTLGDLFFNPPTGSTQDRLSTLRLAMWAPAVGLGLLALVILTSLGVAPLRRRLRWRLPGFRETALAQLAATLHLMLSKGCPLGEALALAQQLEAENPAGAELERWGWRLAQGHGKFAEFAAGGRLFPPLFLWVIAQGAEDLAVGFKRAADLYYQRAVHRIELLLYLALPVSVLVLGFLIVAELLPLMQLLVVQLDMLGDVSGGP